MNNNADNELASLWERYREAAVATGEDSMESIHRLEHVAQHLRTQGHFSCAVTILEIAHFRCSSRYGPTADATVNQLGLLLDAYMATGDLDNLSTGYSAASSLVIQMTNDYSVDHPLMIEVAGLCEDIKAEVERKGEGAGFEDSYQVARRLDGEQERRRIESRGWR